MRKAFFATILAFASNTAFSDEVPLGDHTVEVNNGGGVPKIMKLTSPVYQYTGTPAQIIKKAHACAAKNLSNDQVATSGSSSGLLGSMAGQGHTENSSVSGGSLIELSDPENGQLVANSRTNYTRMLLAYSVKSRFTVEAKDGRFRIVQTDLQSLQKNTGYASNSGYTPLIQRMGTGWEKALTATIETEKKVVDCILSNANDSW